MSKEEKFKKSDTYTFVKSEVLGECKCCKEEVSNDQLYVQEKSNIYHFSCYNKMKSGEDE